MSRDFLPPLDAWTGEGGKRPAISREQVVRAAIELLDEGGISGLTTRRLAERLRIKSPSLYWHVRDKQQLLDLVADAICEDVHPPPDGGDWRARLEAMAWEYRRVLRTHPDAAMVMATTIPVGPNRLRLAEWALSVMLEAGFPAVPAVHAGMLMTDYVTNFVMEEDRDAQIAAAFGPDEADGFQSIREWFAGLPEDEYPTLRALAPHLAGTDADDRFAFGVSVLLTGLESSRSQQET